MVHVDLVNDVNTLKLQVVLKWQYHSYKDNRSKPKT